ncbi:MAG: adenosylcobalamin-dependent ribonucleoside-diphosphate reductase [Planctomycetota bacterium]
MKFTRQFTQPDKDVFKQVEWTTRSSKIANLDGSVVFEMNDAEVPASWSQLATDIMVSKYFRKAGVPQTDADGKAIKDKDGKPVTGPEKSARDVIHRLAGCWRHWGQAYGYFDTDEDAQVFYDELCYMMLNQMAAPNSPQWFNTGLNFAYGINGPAQGHWIADDETGATSLSTDAYTHPQPHACFIQSVGDDLVNEGGIMDLWVREARLFKYGSGTGTNFSNLRGENEPLSGGGKSSGLMSFLKIGDRAAGAIKSGGTTRRAAKMVCLDLDHPDIENFVSWKVREELKVQALVEGMKALPGDRAELAQQLGLELGYDFNNESYQTVSGQNSNNSVRIPDRFFHAIDNDESWDLVRRTDGEVAKTVRARDLWDLIGLSAWSCADPGVQYDSTINAWHTCPESGRINASNPCSEYMFLDNTACNLASLNLLTFYNSQTREFDLARYEHAVRVWTTVLEISVLMAQFPSKEIAELSWKYRTLGLGYANLGAMLMQAGIPYDSERGRAICGCLSSILTGRSYATSAELAKEMGAFDGYADNKEPMLRVMRNHRRAAYGVPRDLVASDKHALGSYEELEIKPVPIDAEALTSDAEPFGKLAESDELATAARQAWDDAVSLGNKHGYRNAQTTVIAPTGTIGLLMDCDTTGVEPDFALVKFKKLAGGGYFKIANQSLKPSLVALGYSDDQVRDILTHVMGTLSLDVPMPGEDGTFADWLTAKGFTPAALDRVKDALPTVFELPYAFNAWTLGKETLEAVGLGERADDPTLDVLTALGLDRKQVKALNAIVCGSQTVEGAPHLTDDHLPVFDCANTCGPTGERFIAPEGHIRMMAAAQPFISGAISKTINLPNSANEDDIKSAYRLSWELGIKANALYRDGCKLSQVLSNKVEDEGEQDEDDIEAVKDELADEVERVVEAAEEDAPVEVREKIVEKIVERVVERPLRRRLSDTRMSKTHKFNVAGHEGYLTVGLYDDGDPGELFITMAKEGSTIGGLMDSLGTAISVALQYGVPVESLVYKFTHQRFEPAGMTHNPDIPFAKSLVDYIFRWMGMEFVSGYREANAPRRGGKAETKADQSKATAKSRSMSKPAGAVDVAEVGVKDDIIGDTASTPRRMTNGNGGGHGDGSGNGRPAEKLTAGRVPTESAGTATEAQADSTLTTAMKDMQADAPACDVCGTITVRNGTCYKCLNCGNSMGCS